jgi:hypothetical protein
MTIGCQDWIDLTKDEFEKIKTAKSKSSLALSVEEKFKLLLENYEEFEKELLDLTLTAALFSAGDWSAGQDEIHSINRRVINLLTTTRLYRDQLRQSFKLMYGPDGLRSLVARQRQQCNVSFAYRIVEELRNYVQHTDLPICGLTLSNTVKSRSPLLLVHSLTPTLSVSNLTEHVRERSTKDARLTPLVVELDNLPETLDLKLLLRQSMESYAAIHEFVRDFMNLECAEFDQVITEHIKSFADRFGTEFIGLSVVEANESGEITQNVAIFEEPIDRRKHLITRNRTNIRYASKIITSAIDNADFEGLGNECQRNDAYHLR